MEAKREPDNTEKVVMTACSSHCGGTCLLKLHIKDGVITRIETDDGEEPQYRACLKGRAYRQRVYAPDRLKYPMKRVGERGKGEFERISWDEALDTVASELKREIPLIPLLSLSHLFVSHLVPVLGRGWCIDNSGVNYGSLT